MAKSEFTPKEIGAIVGAYTGILCGNFDDMHEYIEKIMGRPVFTHEMASKEITAQIKEKAKPDFLRLAEWCCKREGQ